MTFNFWGMSDIMESWAKAWNTLFEAGLWVIVQQSKIFFDATERVLECWESNFSMMQELWGVYKEMLEQHRDPMSHMSTQWNYQTFMRW